MSIHRSGSSNRTDSVRRVVAAVFSYVVLGAGFFTSDKAKGVIHTGVDEATSSLESTSSIIATGASRGSVLPITRTIPAEIKKVTNLH